MQKGYALKKTLWTAQLEKLGKNAFMLSVRKGYITKPGKTAPVALKSVFPWCFKAVWLNSSEWLALNKGHSGLEEGLFWPWRRAKLCEKAMANQRGKWKRKKQEQASSSTMLCQEFSPLGSCLLEHFANGMSAPCQSLFKSCLVEGPM